MSDAKDARPGKTWLMTLFLAGPVVWYLYFWWVYLVAEANCNLAPGLDVMGMPVATLVTIVSTLLAGSVIVAGIVLAGRARARSRRVSDPEPDTQVSADRLEQRGFLRFGAIALGLLFLAATVMTGLPALVLIPC